MSTATASAVTGVRVKGLEKWNTPYQEQQGPVVQS